MNVMSLANLGGVVRDPQQFRGRDMPPCIRRTTLVAIAAAASFAMLATTADVAQAQIGRRGGYRVPAGPGYWVGLSYGYQNGMTIHDGATDQVWQFGYTSQIRATLEKTLQPGVSLGVSASFSSAPLTFTTPNPTPASDACGFQCSATGDITQYMAFVHGGTGTNGFHGIYDLEGGVTELSNFRTKADDSRIGNTRAKYDFSFGLGGGVGYSVSRNAELYFTQIFDFVMHSQGDNTSSSAPRLSTFRAGARIGF
jgi:hypothetical protein